MTDAVRHRSRSDRLARHEVAEIRTDPPARPRPKDPMTHGAMPHEYGLPRGGVLARRFRGRRARTFELVVPPGFEFLARVGHDEQPHVGVLLPTIFSALTATVDAGPVGLHPS